MTIYVNHGSWFFSECDDLLDKLRAWNECPTWQHTISVLRLYILFHRRNFLNVFRIKVGEQSLSIDEWCYHLVFSRTSFRRSIALRTTTVLWNLTLNLFILYCEKPRNVIKKNSFFFYSVIENSWIPHPNKFTLSTLFPIIRKLAAKRFSKSFRWFIEVSARSKRVKNDWIIWKDKKYKIKSY